MSCIIKTSNQSIPKGPSDNKYLGRAQRFESMRTGGLVGAGIGGGTVGILLVAGAPLTAVIAFLAFVALSGLITALGHYALRSDFDLELALFMNRLKPGFDENSNENIYYAFLGKAPVNYLILQLKNSQNTELDERCISLCKQCMECLAPFLSQVERGLVGDSEEDKQKLNDKLLFLPVQLKREDLSPKKSDISSPFL
jgi:hypothetical protein